MVQNSTQRMLHLTKLLCTGLGVERNMGGRYLIADGSINTPSTLSDVQASGCRSQTEIRSQTCQQTYPRYGPSQQESEARKIVEEKVDSQTEIINCLKEGYAGLALIIQTHLNIPIPPLVLPSQTGSSHLGTSGGSNSGPANSGAARVVGEEEVVADEAHIDESTANQANST
ncbi:hypothetical protein PVAP13_2KG120000 [Panicum virgatum]|uniref:Uncharacterized protein n=1 Tax=Panicum virgatum TaxID=38727 RepID=A0A8T0W2F1_PANVG|nr:hypothetical protein PVAP13_2KG120000 [Panicum virgatum]